MVTIIQSLPRVTILTPVQELENQFANLELAGRTCYQSFKEVITKQSAKEFVTKILDSGHESVIEHSCMTVKFSNCSRGMTHELVRHRLCSFSQESTRYVDESNLEFVLPPGISPDEIVNRYDSARNIIEAMQDWYKTLLKAGWKKEDARQFLPIGVTSEIVVSANFRQWRHIFTLRTNKRAHWEIRSAMTTLLLQVQNYIPVIFDDFTLVGNCAKGIPIYEKENYCDRRESDGTNQ